MIKPSSISFLIFLHYTYAYATGTVGSEDYRHEPAIRMLKPRDPIMKTYPFAERKSRDDESTIIEKYFCSPESDEDAANMEEASKNNYKLKYCLFTKHFKKNEERVCKKEVKPVFLEMYNDELNFKLCGFTKQQIIYSISYYDCGDLDMLNNFRDKSFQKNPTPHVFKPKYKYPHEICYDTEENYVLWTQHHVQTPQLFKNPYYQNQREFPENEISTDSYYMEADLFLNIKERYEQEKLKNRSQPDTFIMVPRALVPAEHYARHMLRRATHHYLNMAPLWEGLVPLMTAIDQGLKQAQMALEANNPISYDDLKIYTRVTTSKPVYQTSKTWSSMLLFEGNIWYRFIHRFKIWSGVLIIIHNTPGNPPSKGCLVGKQKECNFGMWTDDKEIRKLITPEMKKYAYCCIVDGPDIKDIFYDNFVIDGYLDIDSLITKGEDHTIPNKKLKRWFTWPWHKG